MPGGVSVHVNIQGDAAFMKKLEGIMPALADWHEALEKTGKHLTNYFGGQVFDSMGGVYGTPWQSLSPSTVAFKSKHFRTYAAVPLMATGEMRKSFEYKAGMTELEVINTAPYFKYHQSTLPRHKLPRRPMFKINRDVKTIIRQSFEETLLAKMAGL